MADLHYWLLLISLTGMFIDLTAAGLIQGSGWLNGEAFYRIMSQLNLYMIVRAVTGVGIVFSLILFFINVFRTITQPAEAHRQTVPGDEDLQVEAT
jgi:cytochrome c oxidase cbb3-type subunit 1/cytochrome c oxidase cbb3-type subunit I/II